MSGPLHVEGMMNCANCPAKKPLLVHLVTGLHVTGETFVRPKIHFTRWRTCLFLLVIIVAGSAVSDLHTTEVHADFHALYNAHFFFDISLPIPPRPLFCWQKIQQGTWAALWAFPAKSHVPTHFMHCKLNNSAGKDAVSRTKRFNVVRVRVGRTAPRWALPLILIMLEFEEAWHAETASLP